MVVLGFGGRRLRGARRSGIRSIWYIMLPVSVRRREGMRKFIRVLIGGSRQPGMQADA